MSNEHLHFQNPSCFVNRPLLPPRLRRVPSGHRPLFSGLFAAAVLLGPAAAQQQFADLVEKRGLPGVATATRALAFADADGDGDTDLFVGADGRSRLYLGHGPLGYFTDVTPTRLPGAQATTHAVVWFDADGDGDLDLFLANAGQDFFWRNAGNGTFVDATASSLPADVETGRAAVAADVDGDGDHDLVVGNLGQSRLLRNDGTGRFVDATAASLPTAVLATLGLAAGDVDGDGDVDLVLGTNGQNRLYRNGGLGVFADATAACLPTQAEETRAVALADVEGDGDLDLLEANHGSYEPVRVLANQGNGVFVDITATAVPWWSTGGDTCLASGDADGDGDVDFAVGTEGSWPGQRFFRNDGAGRFSFELVGAGLFDVGAVALGDADADGDLDLALGRVAGTDLLFLHLGQGDWSLAPRTRLSGTTVATAIAHGDVDGDGDEDLVTGAFDDFGEARLYRNDGCGGFAVDPSAIPVVWQTVSAVALGDVDQDGDLDLVAGNNATSVPGLYPPWRGPGCTLFLNDGTGHFLPRAGSLPVDGFLQSLALGDLDGDGDLDLVDSEGRACRNDGTGGFHQWVAVPISYSAAIALVDLDGDGDLDIVAGGWVHDRLLRNDGNFAFTDVTVSALPASAGPTQALEVGDLDGDGDQDLLLGGIDYANGGSSRLRLYRNDGNLVFADATAAGLPSHLSVLDTSAIALGDIDEDGALDAIVGTFDRSYGQGPSTQRLHWLRNAGSGSFVDATPLLPTSTFSTSSLQLVDVDRDSDLDVVSGHGWWGAFAPEATVRLWTNLLRQLDAPDLLEPGAVWSLRIHARNGQPRWVDVVLPFLALGSASIPLPPLGTIGIDPASLLSLPASIVPQPLGEASIPIAVPNDPGLLGLAVFAQGLLIQHPTKDRLTNAIRDLVVH